MASKKSTKRKTTNKRTNTKTNTRKKGQKTTASQNSLKGEILVCCLLAVCILLTISNFGIGGYVGDAVSGFLFGLFGLLAYVVPIFAFIGIAFVYFNKGNSVAYIKTAAGVILAMMLCTIFQIIDGYKAGSKIWAYYKSSSLHHDGGGFIGGAILHLFRPAFGMIGTVVLVLMLSIICFILITEKSIFANLRKRGEEVYESAKEERQRKKEERQIQKEEDRRQKKVKQEDKRQEEKQRRMEHVVSGVSFDTALTDHSSQMRELTPPALEPENVVINRGMPDEIIGEPVQQVLDLPGIEPEDAEESSPKEKTGRRRRSTKESRQATQEEALEVESQIQQAENKPKAVYQFPPLSLLARGKAKGGSSDQQLRQTAMKLQQTLQSFNVNARVTNVSCGPAVTRYELEPEQGVKVSKIVALQDDIKLNLAAADIRIEAPIPGKAAVGIEVPNTENADVKLRDLLESDEFKNHPSKIAFATGRDIGGKVVVSDIQKMPHVLIAGATGSGKSVCINTIVMSILYKASPEDVKMIMIDPKVVELSVYNGIPHLLIPVVTDPKKAAGALQWAVTEMMKRYDLFAQYGVRDIKGFNAKVDSVAHIEDEDKPGKMPQIVVIVDELADLMMVAAHEVEESVCRLAQLARAAGIHLILATQRPSVDVITGLIKANMPSRIAFAVSSGVDSRTIIDMNGAEKLLGKGDMLFYPSGYPKPVRVQGAFVTDKEVEAVVEYLKKHGDGANYDESITNHMNSVSVGVSASGGGAAGGSGEERDVYFVEAGRFIIEKDKASIGMLQRVFKIGFNRAARIMDQLAEAGVVGEEEGTKPRKVLMSMEEFEQYIEEYV